MKKSIGLVLAAVLLVAIGMLATADTRAILVQSQKPGVTISVDKGCGSVYQHGEHLNITVRSEKAGYLTIFDFMPNKKVQMIFPNQYYQDNYVQAGEYSIPGNILPFTFTVAPPDGEEIVCAVVTAEPFDLLPGQDYDFSDVFPKITKGAEETARMLVERLKIVANKYAMAMCHFYIGHRVATTFGEGWALFIGVNDYDETRYTGEDGNVYYFPKLRYCVKGAREMAAALEPMFPKQKVLLDHGVTHDSVYQAITGWLAQAPEGSTVLIYYSGHGSRVKDRNGDEIDGYDETIVPWDYGKKHQFIVDDEIRRWLSLLKADKVILIFDSCHSGTMERGAFTARLVNTNTRVVEPPLIDGMVNDILPAAGIRGTWWKDLVITACKPNESAYESSRLQNVALTYYLLQALNGKGDSNGDGWVTAQEAYNYAAERVTLDFPKQHPQLTDDIKEAVRLKKVE